MNRGASVLVSTLSALLFLPLQIQTSRQTEHLSRAPRKTARPSRVFPGFGPPSQLPVRLTLSTEGHFGGEPLTSPHHSQAVGPEM